MATKNAVNISFEYQGVSHTKYYHPDYEFHPRTLYWNTGSGYTNSSALNAYGTTNFSNTQKGQPTKDDDFYIGDGRPGESYTSSTLASALNNVKVGRVSGDSSRTQSSSVATLSSTNGPGFDEYSRGASVLPLGWGKVGYNPINSSEFIESSSWKYVQGSNTILLPCDSNGDVEKGYTKNAGADVETASVTKHERTAPSAFLKYYYDGTVHNSVQGNKDLDITALFGLYYKVQFNKNAEDATGDMRRRSGTYVYNTWPLHYCESEVRGLYGPEKLKKNNYQRPHYTFKGWTTDSEGKNTLLSDEADADTVFTTAKPAFGSSPNALTLYAQWEGNKCTVTLDAGEGTGGTSSVSATYDSAMPSATMPTRTGYTFGGYFTAVDGGGTQYYNADGTSAKDWDKEPAEGEDSVTLYAKWTANQTTVRFDADGGTGGILATTATYAQPMPEPITCPTRTGYAFGGYYDAANGGGKKYYNANGTSANVWDKDVGNATLYAKWTANEYTLVVNPNGGVYQGSSVPVTKSPKLVFDSGNWWSIGVATRSGYAFAGWWDAASGGVQVYGEDGKCVDSEYWELTPSKKYKNPGNLTVYAKWDSYAVTFNANGGSVSPSSATVDANGEVTLPIPKRTGYNCTGWYTATSGGTKAGNAGAQYTPTSNITLYARWTAKTYAVTLDADGGTGGTDSVTATYGSAMPSATMPTRTGYTFGGYFTAVDGGGAQYYNADGTSAKNWNIASDTTLYAKWTAKTYNFTRHPNGGTYQGTTEPTVVSANDKTPLTYDRSNYWSIGVPTRTGYTFDGWYTAASGGTKVYGANGERVEGTYWDSAKKYKYDGDLTVYAHWTAKTYAVTLDKQGGSEGASSVTATYDAAMPSATMPTRYGYNFGGYYTGKNGTGTQYYTAQGASARTWNIDSATTLYAKWTAKSVTVSFNVTGSPDGVTQPSSKTVTYGGTYGTLPTFSPSGADFAGWWTASSGGTQITSASTVTNASAHTLYARWSNPWVANITYVLDGGTKGSGSPTTSTYTGVTTIPAPTKSHFRFKGWKVSGDLSSGAKWGKTNSSVTTAITTSSVLIGNSYGDPVYVTNLASKNNASITLTATWQKITYSVTVTKSNADFTVANTSYNLNLSGSTTSKTVSVDAGTSFTLTAAMVYSSFKQMQVARPYSVNGTSQSNNKFARNGVASGNLARFLFTHTFGDNEAASQTWTITAQTVKVTYGAKSGTTIPSGWISELGNPTIQFADTTGTNVKITPPDSTKIESVDHGSARVSPSGYYVSSDSESITVATDKSGDTAPQENGISANLTYDLTRIDVNAAFDSGSAAYAAAAGWSVAVAGGDTATHRQIGYGESATVSITAPQSAVAEFVGWFRNGALVSSSATYQLTNVTSDTTLYAKLRVPVSVRIKYENDIGPETTSVAVKEPGSPSYSEVETPPRTFKVTLGEKFSVRAAALVEPAHFSGWYYYSGSDEQPLGAPTGFAPEQEITATDATNNLVARFTNRANLYYVAVYSRMADTGAFTQNCVFTANNKDGSAGNQNIASITRAEYKTATGYTPEDEKNGGTAKNNVRFFEVTDIQRLVVSAAVNGSAPSKCACAIKKMPNGVETRISERAEFQSVVNGDYAYILDLGDDTRATLAVSTTLDTSVANPRVMGTVRVGSEARDIVVTERVGDRIIGEQGRFVIRRTATIYAFAENGYKFVGWYDNDEMTGTPVSKEAVYSFEMTEGDKHYYAKFVRASYALYEWEGGEENKLMTWRSKVYELSKPANLTSVRVDTRWYPVERFKSESFSAPDAAPTRTVDFKYVDEQNDTRLASQTMRRLPQRRPERYFQVEVQNDAEVDAIIIGTSGEGLAT